jgi:PAS domain S-box-containing protein
MTGDEHKTKEQLISELAVLRQRISELEASETERKRAEEALRESEAKYSTLVEQARDGIIILQDEVVRYCNNAAAEMIGYMQEELIGIHFLDTVPPDSRDIVTQRYQARLAGKEVPSVYETKALCKAGTTKDVEASGVVIQYEGKPADMVFARDITERKQAEEALREREERLRSLFETMSEGVVLISSDGTIVQANRAAEHIAGIKRSDIEGHSYDSPEWELLRPDGTRMPPEEWAAPRTMKEKRPIKDMVMGVKRPDGSISWINVNTTPIIDNAGEMNGIVLTFADITEHKQAEEALRESEEKLRRMFESANDGITVIDLNGVITEANKRIAEILGFGSRQEVLGKSAFDYTAPSDHKRAMMNMQKTLEEDSVEGVEYTLLKSDGSKFPAELSASAFRDASGSPAGFITIIRDITERKRAEEALRESEVKYSTLVEQATDMVSIIQDGVFKFCNKAAEEITGYTHDEFVGRPFIDFVAPESRDLSEQRHQTRMAGKEVPPVVEIKIPCKDGTLKDMELSAGLIQYKGRPALMGIGRDITERKKAEEALRESEAKYSALIEQARDAVIILQDGVIKYCNKAAAEITGYTQETLLGMPFLDPIQSDSRDIVAQRYQARLAGKEVPNVYELQVLRQDGTLKDVEASGVVIQYEGKPADMVFIRDITERKRMEDELAKMQKLESLGTLAGGIAHDFNNILTGILGNVSLAKSYIEPKGKVFDRLVEAEKASLRAKDLTQQLLTFARGGAPITKTASIARLIEESATFALRGSKVKCEFSLPVDLSPVEIDEGQISQVISNLVLNADEAMPEGGIIEIRAKNTVVSAKDVSSLSEGKYVQIDINDHGVGIAKQHLQRIFDPYFTTKQKGSGLGLSTAYSIIKNHSGHIAVGSKLGVGTTFHIYLPVSEKPVPVEEQAVAETLVLDEGRILVMDDEEDIRELLGSVLGEVGYEVEFTREGAEAIEQYVEAKDSGQPFDAVILDLTVPGGVGGKEVIEKLLEIDPEVKAIVSSGYSTDPIMADFRKYGFRGVIAKPYKIGELKEIVRRVITE